MIGLDDEPDHRTERSAANRPSPSFGHLLGVELEHRGAWQLAGLSAWQSVDQHQRAGQKGRIDDLAQCRHNLLPCHSGRHDKSRKPRDLSFIHALKTGPSAMKMMPSRTPSIDSSFV